MSNDPVDTFAAAFGAELARSVPQALGLKHETESETADKSIDEVYRDRNLLVIGLARTIVDAYGLEGVGWYEHDEWAVIAVHLPTGLCSWHVRPEMVPDWLPERDPETWFDGHTRETKNLRLETFALEPDYQTAQNDD